MNGVGEERKCTMWTLVIATAVVGAVALATGFLLLWLLVFIVECF